jgi:hypothetical protein
MASFVGLSESKMRKRPGRPPRTCVDAMRTTAWSRAVMSAAGETTAAGLARRVSHNELGRDQLALDDDVVREYLTGARSPMTRLAPIERVFPGTREVFDVGPAGLPLWGALEGDLPNPAFARVVDADILPAGDVPFYCWLNLSPVEMEKWFRESVAQSCLQISPELIHLFAFCAAVYLDRWHEQLGRAATSWRYMLIKATLTHSTAKRYLDQFGVFQQLVEWVELREFRRLGADDRARRNLEELAQQRGLAGGTAVWLSNPMLFVSMGSPPCSIFADRERCDDEFVDCFGDLVVQALLDEGFDEEAHRVRCSRRNGSTNIAKAVVELGDQVLGPQMRVALEHLH